ncbi:MAG TPA: copper chaperone PCu(A)C [Alcaligenes sp.]|nr:copper chaperone PCu(A)C [Alcaligenes sp.]HRL26623.1 copper chaperone PCu(A)C [Alcaligenes sp.]
MQRTFISSLIGLALLGVSSLAQAQVTIAEPWVRATVTGQQATGAFMTLQSTDQAKLVGVRSPLTQQAEIHEMVMDKDVMRMRQVQHIDLPAGKAVELKPGSYHIMLMGLKQQVNAGSDVDLTLLIETAAGQKQEIAVRAPVRALNAKASQGHHGGHGHKAH